MPRFTGGPPQSIAPRIRRGAAPRTDSDGTVNDDGFRDRSRHRPDQATVRPGNRALPSDLMGSASHPNDGVSAKCWSGHRLTLIDYPRFTQSRPTQNGPSRTTLLCLSSGECWRRRVFEESPDSSRDVALEAAHDFSFGLAFGESTGHVRAGCRVALESGGSDDVERVVHSTVPSTIEAVTVLGLSGRRRDGGGSGESGERGFGAATTAMRPRQHERRCGDVADPGLAEQLGRDLSKQRRHCPVVIGDLGVEMGDAPREGAHREPRALLGGRASW